jgi:hypothetical protein
MPGHISGMIRSGEREIVGKWRLPVGTDETDFEIVREMKGEQASMRCHQI